MITIKRLILDILKPHHPDVIEFASVIASQGKDYQVKLRVIEMDDNTQTLEVTIEASDIQLDGIVNAINELGGSLHSIDGVDVVNAE